MIGWTERPADLSDLAAIARLAAAVPSDAPLVSSDLSRAVETARAISERHPERASGPHEMFKDLREMHFGDWEGRRHGDVEAEDPARIRAFWDQPGDIAPPGGESWNALSSRVEAQVQALLAHHDRLIVVAHFGVILSQVQRAMGWTALEAFGQRIEPLSLTEITYAPRRGALRINHCP